MKILNKENNKIIEVTDKNVIDRFLGYPDRFEKVKSKKEEEKEEKPQEKNK